MDVTITIQHDESRQRFVTPVEGGEASLVYRPAGEGVLEYLTTYVPESARRRGIGERIVRHALDYARDHGYRVIPSCWFVGDVIERHPEYRALVASR